jgi:hypothetical protein
MSSSVNVNVPQLAFTSFDEKVCVAETVELEVVSDVITIVTRTQKEPEAAPLASQENTSASAHGPVDVKYNPTPFQQQVEVYLKRVLLDTHTHTHTLSHTHTRQYQVDFSHLLPSGVRRRVHAVAQVSHGRECVCVQGVCKYIYMYVYVTAFGALWEQPRVREAALRVRAARPDVGRPHRHACWFSVFGRARH